MKNRKWLANQSPIDMLMRISEICCPLWAINGKPPIEWKNGECSHMGSDWSEYNKDECYLCVQAWLNKEKQE